MRVTFLDLPVDIASMEETVDLALKAMHSGQRMQHVALNVAKSLQDLSPLRSVGLHKLKGDRKNQWAMTVNERWRICFEFRKSDAFDVEIVDYHRG